MPAEDRSTESSASLYPRCRLPAAYCVLQGIDYVVEECPMAAGNRHLGYKEALDSVERSSAGTKHAFYFGFLQRAAELFAAGVAEGHGKSDLGRCERCGAPSTSEVCTFCRLVERSAGAEPVALRPRGGR